MKGILLVAHGSRVQETKEIAYRYFEDLRKKYKNCKLGFMEFNEPSIENAVKEFLKEKVEEIVVLPLFLFEGIHIKKDIPEILEKYPIKFKILKPILYDKRVSGILFERIEKGEIY